MLKKEYINIANILTLSRMVCGFIFLFLFLYVKVYNPAPIKALIIEIISFFIFIFAIITDGLDGYFARKSNNVTDFGKHFDPLSDSIFFIIVFFTFWIIKLMPIYLFIIIFIREAFMHLFLRPYVKKKGSILPASIFGKIKTIFQCIFSLIILFFLIIKEILLIFKVEIGILSKSIEIGSFIFFVIIVFLSLWSLFLYLFNLNKITSKKIC